MTHDLQQTVANTLYDRDFYSWIQTTAQLLKEKKWEEVDTFNLIEELESMGRSEKRELKNRAIVLLTHLMKWKYQADKRSSSWLNTISEQRRQIKFLLEDSPSLNPYYLEIFDRCYQFACQDAAKETGLPADIFPAESPFTPELTIDDDYLPDERPDNFDVN
jgi:hypothetical protein